MGKCCVTYLLTNYYLLNNGLFHSFSENKLPIPNNEIPHQQFTWKSRVKQETEQSPILGLKSARINADLIVMNLYNYTSIIILCKSNTKFLFFPAKMLKYKTWKRRISMKFLSFSPSLSPLCAWRSDISLTSTKFPSLFLKQFPCRLFISMETLPSSS